MKFRPTGKLSAARLLLAAMAILMIAAVACASGSTTSEPAAQPDNSSGGSESTGAGQTGSNEDDGSSTGAVVDPAQEQETAADLFEQATGDLFLQMTSPATDEMFVTDSSFEFEGRTTVDALVSVNDAVLEVDEEGRFAYQMALEEGPNVIEVIASNALGQQFDEVLLVIYEPV